MSAAIGIPMWMRQADALFDAAPVSGVRNVVLDTVRNGRLNSFGVYVVWTVQPTPLEVYVTLDGREIKHSVVNPVSAAPYYLTLLPYVAESAQSLATLNLDNYKPWIYQGKTMKIEAESTGGTVSKLYARAKYSLRT